jgi:ribonuclease HI
VRLVNPFAGPKKVYVDAKILNVHDPRLPRKAYVGYLVHGDGRQGAREVEEMESDDAEVRAILFAIEELRGTVGRMTIVCDHESVVSEANREVARDPSPLMRELRETLGRNRKTIRLRALQANPAHAVVTAYVNSLKEGQQGR